jgi:hypothetical protein
MAFVDQYRVKSLLLVASHALALVVGFAFGVYMLPILVAPNGLSVCRYRSAGKVSILQGTVSP